MDGAARRMQNGRRFGALGRQCLQTAIRRTAIRRYGAVFAEMERRFDLTDVINDGCDGMRISSLGKGIGARRHRRCKCVESGVIMC